MSTNCGASPISQNPDLIGELQRVFTGPFIEVNPAFELVHDIPTEPMEEVIIAETENRFLVVANSGRTALMHTLLVEARLPVLSALGSESLLLLSVPPGTRPLSHVLAGVQRNPRNGTLLFHETGKVIRDLEARGLGFPKSALNQFAIVTDSEDARGAKVCMVPPYELDTEQSIEGFLDQSHAELDLHGVRSQVASQLVDSLRSGFNDNE